MLGATEVVLVCRTAADGVTVSPCPSGQAPVSVQAYMLDTSAQTSLEASLAPIDFAEAGLFWGLSFGLVLSVWSLAHMFRQATRAIH